MSLRFIERITPEHNVEQLLTRSAREGNERVIIGRHCEGCGEQHDPDVVFHGGRYRVHHDGAFRWYCVVCYLARFWK